MSKRKWKVYTTDELRDRFQAKPGSNPAASDDQKVVVPNLKRRNSAPPGMIHFPPGTFTGGSGSGSGGGNHNQGSHSSNHPYVPTSPVPAPAQQHDLVTHINSSSSRASPTSNNKTHHPYSSYPSRLERRRASLPFIPSSNPSVGPPHAGGQGPSIEAYLAHLASIPLAKNDDDEDVPQPPLSPSHTLPSFQSLLQTIREDADEEDSEIREIEERANGSPIMQTSKTLPMNYKEMTHNKSPQQSHYQHEQHPFYSSSSHSNFSFTNNKPQDPPSPSGKFYKSNSLSKSNENLPSLSRMSISDILG